MSNLWKTLNRLIAHLKMGWALFRLSRNPQYTEAVFDIGEALYSLGATESARKKFLTSPEAVATVQARKLLGPIDLHQLSKLPAGTLGKCFADHMLGLGLKVDFYRNLEVKDDTIFVMMRIRQTHDLWHLMTGFKTDVPGEIGLQAFMAAQMAVPISLVLMGASLLKVGTSPSDQMDAIMENIVKGWQLGKKAKSIFAIDWEANWATPIDSLKLQYNLN